MDGTQETVFGPLPTLVVQGFYLLAFGLAAWRAVFVRPIAQMWQDWRKGASGSPSAVASKRALLQPLISLTIILLLLANAIWAYRGGAGSPSLSLYQQQPVQLHDGPAGEMWIVAPVMIIGNHGKEALSARFSDEATIVLGDGRREPARLIKTLQKPIVIPALARTGKVEINTFGLLPTRSLNPIPSDGVVAGTVIVETTKLTVAALAGAMLEFTFTDESGRRYVGRSLRSDGPPQDVVSPVIAP